MRTSICGLLLVLTFTVAGCGEEGLKGEKAEVKETTIQLDLPEVPDFAMPSPLADGTHGVTEMRLKGQKLLETELQIKGKVTWIYNCIAEVRGPEMTDKDAQKLIDADPTLCNRPHFFIGDEADTPPEKCVWVVETPRKLRKDELKRLTRDEKRALPPVPKLALGDEVIVNGTWDINSPKGFANSDGLLVYKSLQNLTEGDGQE